MCVVREKESAWENVCVCVFDMQCVSPCFSRVGIAAVACQH